MGHLASIFKAGASLALFGLSPVQAQMTAPTGQAKTDQQLNRERAEHKAAILSGDPKLVAREKAELRSAYAADWHQHHARGTSDSKTLNADQRLAAARERFEAVFKTGNKPAIVRERRKLRLAYVEAHRAHEHRGPQ